MVVKNERKRYLLVEFDGQVPEDKYLIHKLRKKLAYLGGQFALARSSLHLIAIKEQFAIIRATHDSRDLVEASLQLLELSNTSIAVRYVSGTIAKINQVLNTDFQDDTDSIDEF